MFYKKLIKVICNYFAQELELSNKEKDRIEFGLEIFVSQTASFIVALLIAQLLGIFYYVLIILLVSGLMKLIAGGIHFKTVLECIIFTSLISNFFGLLALELNNKFYQNWFFYLLILTFTILYSMIKWAPAKVENKKTKDQNKKLKLKIISILFSLFWIILIYSLFVSYQRKFLLLNSSIFSGLLLHILSINPLSYKFINHYYNKNNNLKILTF